MGYARSRTVDHLLCSVYHCVSRCVRRQFLITHEVRAALLEQRLELLASLFAVDVLEYAILTNHLHLLLRIRPELSWCWTAQEVAERWLTLRAADPLSRAGDPSIKPDKDAVEKAASDEVMIDEWRRRLANLGWFHKQLKEPCARLWNVEDEVGGHFWQGRYSSKVALDDVAVTAQAFYVMLNPIRAGVESGVARSSKTSIAKRLQRIVKEIRAGEHGDAIAAFDRRVVNGSWEPVFPCDAGSVAALDDGEYERRVAAGKRKARIREAVLQEAEAIEHLAFDSPVEELVPLLRGEANSNTVAQRGCEPRGAATVETDANGSATYSDASRPCGAQLIQHSRVLRHRLRRRQTSRPRAPIDDSGIVPACVMENPFKAERIERGSMAVLPGMKLGTLLQLLEVEGRQAQPGKRGKISETEPAALERFRAMAMGIEVHEQVNRPVRSLLVTTEVPASEPHTTERENRSAVAAMIILLSSLSNAARSTVERAFALFARHRTAIAEMLKGTTTSPTACNVVVSDTESASLERAEPPSTPKRSIVQWYGTASGELVKVTAEAGRRQTAWVVTERPIIRTRMVYPRRRSSPT